MTTPAAEQTESAPVRAGRRPGPPGTEERREKESRAEETAEVLAAGAWAGGRAGALAFLALLALLGAAVHFYMTDNSGEYAASLDAELLRDAELSLALRADDAVAVAPSWPGRLHARLRRDIALYAAAAAAAAYLWARAARARGRRDAFLLHDRLAEEIAELREKIKTLEKKNT